MSVPKSQRNGNKVTTITILDSGEWVRQPSRQFNHQTSIATFGNVDIETNQQVWHNGQKVSAIGGLNDGRVMVRPDQNKRQWLILDAAQVAPI